MAILSGHTGGAVTQGAAVLATIAEHPIVLRDMMPSDLEVAVELSNEYSWPHRIEDWEQFFQLGEGLVATYDGAVVGTIMAFRFGDDYASIAMVIVRSDLHRRGIARSLVEAMIARLKGRNIILNATHEAMTLYTSLGFVPCGIVHQHQGPAPTMPLVEPGEGERVRPLGQADLELPALYSKASGMDRAALFAALASGSTGVVLSRHQEPVGFALLRRFGRGLVIAPLVAPDLDGAKALATHFLGANAGRYCRIDVIEGLGISRWLEAMGLPRVGTVTTMVLGTAPAARSGSRVFGIANQALG